MGILFKDEFLDRFGTGPLACIPFGGADFGEAPNQPIVDAARIAPNGWSPGGYLACRATLDWLDEHFPCGRALC